jgi:hypothetical protein
MTRVDAGSPRNVWTPTNQDELQLWNERRGETHAISHENWAYPNRVSSKYSMTINCIHTISHGEHISFHTIVLYGCEWVNQHTENELFLHKILWTDETCFTHDGVFNVHKSPVDASASTLGLELSEGSSWAPICYLTRELLSIIMIF